MSTSLYQFTSFFDILHSMKENKTSPKTKKTIKNKKEQNMDKKISQKKSKKSQEVVKTTSLLKEKMAEKKDVQLKTPQAMKKLNLPVVSTKKSFILFLIVLLALVLYLTKDKYLAAMVNGEVITRYELRTELEKQFGQQSLEGLITKKLVLQEAKKQKVSVTKEDLDKKIAEIEEGLKAQNQTLDQVLAMQGLMRKDVEEQIKLQLMVEKMVGSDVQVSEEEVNSYLEENKEFLPEGMKEDELRASATDQLKQQKINTQIQDWLKKIQSEAKVKNYAFPELTSQVTPVAQ